MALRKYVTELIGTFFLVAVIGLSTTGGTDGKGTPMAPLAIGCGLLALVYMGGHASSAHYNPAVSLAFLVRGKMSFADFIPYIISQLAGAVLAALFVRMLRGAAFGVHPPSGVPLTNVLLAEVVFTFALALVVVNVATAPKNAGNSFYGMAIGLIVTAGVWSVGNVSGAAFNPSVGTGPAIVELMSGKSGALNDVWIYWAAPMAGGLLAGLVCTFQVGPESASKSRS